MDHQQADPKGLIRESYAIEAITAPECRSIFLDWALSLGADVAPKEAMAAVLAQYGAKRETHPMTVTLQAGLAAADTEPKRRGGRAARVGEG